MKLPQSLTPNASPRSFWLWAAGWFALWVLYWGVFRPEIFPSPAEVISALPHLWSENGLGQELVTSFTLNFEALALSTVLSLVFAYLSTVPALTPLALAASKLRFVSPAIFFFVFVVATSSGSQLKLAILTMGITVFFTTQMIGAVHAIPKEKFDHARTLRMSEWQTVWYVIIQGTKAQAIDAIRDNAAMGWSMLTMVEGLVRQDGGIGVMIIDQNKHLNLANVYAAATVVILVGLFQDYTLGLMKGIVAPYDSLKLENT